MSGLLALLDDVAAMVKLAATSVDDVAAQAVKTGAKAAGVVVDDAAVTPQYLKGLSPARELPIVWRIARGSVKNKLLYLLPAAMLLSAFAPWAITPLLMLGGAYLSFEGAEKILHVLRPSAHPGEKAAKGTTDPAHLEEKTVSGAIKTDFILSAEIMTITLAAIPQSNIWMEGAVLATVGVAITAVVYGSVALIVKADDLGLHLALPKHPRPMRALGRGIVRFMPGFMTALTIVGTAAMLWVGGSIIVHGLKALGAKDLYYLIENAATGLGQMAGRFEGIAQWSARATMDGLVGLALGLVLVPVTSFVLLPAWRLVRPEKTAEN